MRKRILTILYILIICFTSSTLASGTITLKTNLGCKFFFEANNKNEYKKYTSSWSGGCKGGLLEGHGLLKIYLPNGKKLEESANFVRGLENGEGEENWYLPNKNKEINKLGTYKDGKFIRGTIKAKYLDKNIITTASGDFMNDALFGEGIYEIQFLSDEVIKTYEGKFTNNQDRLQGKATYQYNKMNQMDILEGHFVNFKLEGQGTYDIYINNELVEKINGNFTHGDLNGVAIIFDNRSKTSWTGNMTNNKRNGVGILTKTDGTKDWLAYENDQVPNVGTGDGTNDHYYCAVRGLRPGTLQYSQCRVYYHSQIELEKDIQDANKRFDDLADQAQKQMMELDRRNSISR